MVRGRFTRPWLLVLVLSAGQFACLAFAVFLFARLTERGIGEAVAERSREVARRVAAQTTELIRSLDLGDLSEGSPDRQRLERIITHARLPEGGHLTAIDSSDGTIVFRPGAGPSGGAHLPVGSEDGEPLAVYAVPELGIDIVAHAGPAREQVMEDSFMARLRLVAMAVTIALAGLLAVGTALVVRRYENRLSESHDDLQSVREKRTQALLQSRSAIILGLAKLAESRDDQTGRHLERIRAYVRILGKQLLGAHPEVDEEFVATIVDTCTLHDIGKVGIPDDVLLKPGALTEEQRTIIRKHPLIAGDTLLAIMRRWGDDAFLVTACQIAFAHHERFDGTGYPFGLTGDIIPLSARIVALADVYDALTTERAYKDALGHQEARQIIVDSSGTHFDPDVVAAFVATEDQFRAISERGEEIELEL